MADSTVTITDENGNPVPISTDEQTVGGDQVHYQRVVTPELAAEMVAG
jgi:hypothetical protein